MYIKSTSIPDVKTIEPKVFKDKRGFFMESFNQKVFEANIGRSVTFVQDNHSKSTRSVLRGLHYQIEQAQGKLVRVTQGEVFDVAVDLRQSSPTFGEWVGEYLSEDNFKQLWVPEGFAHGFLVLSETAEFVYKTTDYYAPEHERSVIWDDQDLDIKWPLDVLKMTSGQLLATAKATPTLSPKDQQAPTFKNAEYYP